MNIVVIWMLDMEIHVHLILGGALTTIFGAVIFLIAMLDNPFRGEFAVGAESITRVYETMIHIPAGAPAPEAGAANASSTERR